MSTRAVVLSIVSRADRRDGGETVQVESSKAEQGQRGRVPRHQRLKSRLDGTPQHKHKQIGRETPVRVGPKRTQRPPDPTWVGGVGREPLALERMAGVEREALRLAIFVSAQSALKLLRICEVANQRALVQRVEVEEDARLRTRQLTTRLRHVAA